MIHRNGHIIPIEVKSGKSGKMQSLHLFLKEKQVKYGIRTSLENFSKYDNIRVYPLYAIGNVEKQEYISKKNMTQQMLELFQVPLSETDYYDAIIQSEKEIKACKLIRQAMVARYIIPEIDCL